MTNSGHTASGISYPIAGIDEFTPAQGMQDMAETAEAVIDERARYIQAADAAAAQADSAADPVNVYWVAG